MRINIYSQELTSEVTLVSKTDERGNTHYGVRMFLASPDILHHTPDDDDRSAVTFWIPDAERFTVWDLHRVFMRACDECETASRKMSRKEGEQTGS